MTADFVSSGGSEVNFLPEALISAVSGPIRFAPLQAQSVRALVRRPVSIVWDAGNRRIGISDESNFGSSRAPDEAQPYSILGVLPPLYPEWLGGREFQTIHKLRFAYIGGAMARGIGSADLVIQLAKTGALGMFGSAGLSIEVIEAELTKIAKALDPPGLPWGSNLIHSPNEPRLEEKIVDLYLRMGVRRVSAAAFMGLSPAIVRYACTGLVRTPDGCVQRQNYVFAKISREEVAHHFLAPAPQKLLNQLVAAGQLTPEEADIAGTIPLAEDIIVESDSGGHTDNRPLNALFSSIMKLRDQLSAEFNYRRPIRLGAAGGLGTPASVAAAYALGASFVLIGSVHQGAVESGVSDDARRLLAQADITDVAMTASSDMFEMGVKVQVLTKGTMMAVRGNLLYDLYQRFNSIDSIPVRQREQLEKTVFRAPLNEIWAQTQVFFKRTDPVQVERAERDPKHRMALIFRWYLGNSSRWPIVGETARQVDYQLWCSPAMGAFNRWVQGSFLETAGNRTVQQIVLNLLEGAAQVTRAHQLRACGVTVAADAFSVSPEVLRI